MVRRKGFEFQLPVLFHQLFDPLFGLSQCLFTCPGQGYAPFEILQRLLKCLVSLFHPFDKLLQLVKMAFEF